MPGIVFEVISDMKLRIINVALVMTDCPFGGFLSSDGVGPPESYDTRPNGDAEPPGFRFGTAGPRTTSPRWCRLEQRRCRRDHLGAREPQAQCVDRPQLARRDTVGE
ncbi:hypothetical protein PP451_15750 [Mycobacteroides abscessus]|uniref:hypothetical protein n=1 Tax=Mycobacteroides TaxID=670516 RepID=UPI000231A075|nr:hypothetical protein [Mycobacteroides abscessus]SIM86206.1 Uncharacterised protein [Mycobacteroides abscessus subsp. abscessus]EHB97345.1 hypothetical protein MAB47J26_21603 [Mycobacteroides abscessus 47J26]MDM2239206.1 hypothetical protein [Mycobacteroides abscessus]MDM2247428.1 hypothetical protein [Mycobacteroides abscessus]MDM2257345.1 hypothetical protein [Mycobacteroides abscessus]